MRQDDVAAEFERLYSEMSRPSRHGRFEPNADVYLSDDGQTLVVNVEVAGADPSELRVGLEELHLIIMGVRPDRERAVRGSLLMKEIEFGPFLKRIHLPIAVNYDEATASYRDGMLVIRMPVAERAYVPTSRTEVKITVKRIPV